MNALQYGVYGRIVGGHSDARPCACRRSITRIIDRRLIYKQPQNSCSGCAVFYAPDRYAQTLETDTRGGCDPEISNFQFLTCICRFFGICYIHRKINRQCSSNPFRELPYGIRPPKKISLVRRPILFRLI